MDNPRVVNKLVFDHLQASVPKKLADEFAQSVGKENISKKLEGIPSIMNMVSKIIKNHYLPTNGAVTGKRKVAEVNGHPPKAKKPKQVEKSKEVNAKKAEEEFISDGDNSDSDEDEQSAKKTEAKLAKDESSNVDDSDGKDEESETNSDKPQVNKEDSSADKNSCNEDTEKSEKNKDTPSGADESMDVEEGLKITNAKTPNNSFNEKTPRSDRGRGRGGRGK